MENHSDNVVKSSEIIGVKVINLAKESLGKIEEIVLNKLSGQAHYVVLSFGGMLWAGDKYFAFPWKSISYSPEDEAFILQVSKEKLEKAPGFDKDHWPDMAEAAWGKEIDMYYQ